MLNSKKKDKFIQIRIQQTNKRCSNFAKKLPQGKKLRLVLEVFGNRKDRRPSGVETILILVDGWSKNGNFI